LSQQESTTLISLLIMQDEKFEETLKLLCNVHEANEDMLKHVRKFSTQVVTKATKITF